jgi:anti-anti-sigma regulatory factor
MEEPLLLRISLVATHAEEARLILEGEISAEWVQVLEQQCFRLLEEKARVVLDFKSVTSIDREGTRMLKGLSSPRFRFVECSPIIANLLGTG